VDNIPDLSVMYPNQTHKAKKTGVPELLSSSPGKKDVSRLYGFAEDEQVLLLNEQIQQYIGSPLFIGLEPKPKTNMSFTDLISDKILLIQAIKRGIPFSIFSAIQDITPFTLNDWANYLDLSGKSLSRYEQSNKSFKSIHTEKIFELAEVSLKGLEVFGNKIKFRLWLETPNFALGNLKPFELLSDSYGKEMIIGELTRIEHGILG